jgi:hypothetical protein
MVSTHKPSCSETHVRTFPPYNEGEVIIFNNKITWKPAVFWITLLNSSYDKVNTFHIFWKTMAEIKINTTDLII